MYRNRIDVRSLDLRVWARWVAAGRPVNFSLLGNSIFTDAFRPHDRHRHREASILWRESDSEASARVAHLMRIDGRLVGALSGNELRLLLAAVAPSGTGAPLPLTERAELAGVTPDALREIRRKALEFL